MDELENEIDGLTQQLADLEEKQADQDDKRRGSNQAGDGCNFKSSDPRPNARSYKGGTC